MDFGAFLLEQQVIAGAQAEDAPNLMRDSDLSLARDFGPFCHSALQIPYSSICLLTFGSDVRAERMVTRLIEENREAERGLDVEIELGDFGEGAIQDGAVAGLERHHE